MNINKNRVKLVIAEGIVIIPTFLLMFHTLESGIIYLVGIYTGIFLWDWLKP